MVFLGNQTPAVQTFRQHSKKKVSAPEIVLKIPLLYLDLGEPPPQDTDGVG